MQMSQSTVGRRRVGGELQVLLGLWLMLGVCSLSVFGSSTKHCLPFFLYGSEKMIWKEKRRSRIRAVEIRIRRMDKVPNAWIRKLCGVI